MTSVLFPIGGCLIGLAVGQLIAPALGAGDLHPVRIIVCALAGIALTVVGFRRLREEGRRGRA